MESSDGGPAIKTGTSKHVRQSSGVGASSPLQDEQDDVGVVAQGKGTNSKCPFGPTHQTCAGVPVMANITSSSIVNRVFVFDFLILSAVVLYTFSPADHYRNLEVFSQKSQVFLIDYVDNPQLHASPSPFSMLEGLRQPALFYFMNTLGSHKEICGKNSRISRQTNIPITNG